MPSRKEIQWSQLRVGGLVLLATAVLIGLIFLMSGSTGGLFAHKLVLRCYFDNAGGVKDGAPVMLQGVTVGNVTHVHVVPDRNPTPVEVTMQVGHNFVRDLHVDSTATITQAGVLGDSFIDIDSSHATGPPPHENAELRESGTPSIQDVIRTSQVSIAEINGLTRKIETLVDTLNSRRGTIGDLINDPALGRKITQIASDLQTITASISEGKGSAGKFLKDETLYNNLNSTVSNANQLIADVNAGKGSAGKFLKEETLYNNLNSTVSNANQLISEVNAGKGALGKLAKDPAFAQKLDDTVTRLNSILKGIDEGKGTLGQLAQNRSLFDHADQTMDQTQQLVKSIRDDPKKYLVIRLKVF